MTRRTSIRPHRLARAVGASPPPAAADESELRRLLQDLQLHQLELEQQNEELQATRQQLGVSLRRYVELYEKAPVGLVTLDREGIVEVINEHACALIGQARADLAGRHLHSFLTPDAADALSREIGALWTPDRICSVDLALAGLPRMLRAGLKVHPEAPGRLLLALEDVTERHRAEAEVARTREILELSCSVSRTGFHEFDVETGVAAWSPTACTIFGVEPGFEPSLASTLDFYREGGHRERLRSAVAAALSEGTPFDLEVQAVTRQGAGLWLRAIGVPLPRAGAVRRLHVTVQDIGARIQLEEARLARARAESANRAKSAFLSRMSHELRTPLNAILGFSELLGDDAAVRASPAAAAQVGHVYRAGTHLLALVDDLLDLARVDADATLATAEPLAPQALVAECVALVLPFARRRGVALDFDTADPGAPVRADATRLRQVLVNLLTNAVKSNEPGGSVVVALHTEDTQVGIEVRDTGMGMTPEQIEGLFEPFNRLGAGLRGTEGTGLGLTVARQFVHAMGGTIEVASRAGEGSRFTVRLPRA